MIRFRFANVCSTWSPSCLPLRGILQLRPQLTQYILTSEDSFDPLASQTESWFLIDLGKYWLWLEFPFQEVKERSRSRAGATSRNRLWSRTISRGKDCWAVAASKKDRPVKPCSTSSIQHILQCRTVLFIALSSGNQLVTNCTQQLEDWLIVSDYIGLRIKRRPIKPTRWPNEIPGPTGPPWPTAPLAAS